MLLDPLCTALAPRRGEPPCTARGTDDARTFSQTLDYINGCPSMGLLKVDGEKGAISSIEA